MFFILLVGFLTAQKKLSVGYLPNWAYSGYTNLDYAALTHVNIAFCNPNANGDLSAGINNNDLKAIVDKAHANGVKVMASLGGAGGSAHYIDLIKDPASRVAFSEKIISFVQQHNLDGVDLDIEGEVGKAFWDQYEHWVFVLHPLCQENNLLLTTAVGQWYAGNITTYTFTLFDYITIMEYDLKANNYQARIDYYLNRQVPANKISLGVPFFGHKNGEEVAYNQIIKENPDAWKTSSWNGYTYHNPKDIADITELSKKYNGVMHWDLSEDVQGKYSLLKAIKDQLYGSGYVFPPA